MSLSWGSFQRPYAVNMISMIILTKGSYYTLELVVIRRSGRAKFNRILCMFLETLNFFVQLTSFLMYTFLGRLGYKYLGSVLPCFG